MAEHGTRTRFSKGCTDGPEGTACDPCRQANNDYFKKRALVKKAEKIAGVTTLTTRVGGDDLNGRPRADEFGPVELGVITSLAKVPAAVEARPDLAASARAMARIQDSALTVAQATNAARQMREIMADLMKGSAKKRKLASVRQMTNPTLATG